MKNHKRGFAHFISATAYSLSGLRYAVKESAFRQEIMLGVCHIVLCYFVDLAVMEKVILSVLLIGVMVVELLNTSIETIVDLVSPEYNELAKKAKDIASAAVMISLLAFVGAWIVLVSF